MTNSVSEGKPRSVEGLFLWAVLGFVLMSLVLIVIYPIASLWYSETKGPYRGITDVADLDGDGDQDALLGGKKQAVIWWNVGKGSFTQSD